MKRLAIIGGGPAGLRAAEVASAEGLAVTLYESQRSTGRKFLVAGKGGLNLTHTEAVTDFAKRYQGPDMPEDFWDRALAEFDNEMIRGWAARLEVGTFAAKSGRVYPKALKAAPLLRAWLRRLREQGVTIEVNHRLTSIVPGSVHTLSFEHQGVEKTEATEAVIFAMGGGSWPRTGSDGQWLSFFEENLGVSCAPLTSANCGWELAWPTEFLVKHEGAALKNLLVRANGQEARGELVITKYGLEGGPIYQLGAALRAMADPTLEIDFKPTFTYERMVAKMESARRDFLHEARLRWKLSEAATDLIADRNPPFTDATELAKVTKNCALPLVRPRPLAEAISSAGGVPWGALNDQLMLVNQPGCFVAGEMMDWEAPTGGYLMQGCFASGTLAARSAIAYLNQS